MRALFKLKSVAHLDRKVDRRTIVLARQLALEKRWRELITVVRGKSDLEGSPSILVNWLRAAVELADDEEIGRCHMAIRRAEPDNLVKIAKMLLSLKLPEQAAIVLAALPHGYLTRGVVKLCIQINKSTKDKAAKQRIERFAYSKPVWQNDVVNHRFPGDSDDYLVPPSVVTIVRLDGVEEEIESKVRENHANFLAVLGSKPSPYVTEYRDVFVNEIGQIWEAGQLWSTGKRNVPEVNDPSSVPMFDEAFGCTGVHKGYFEWLVRRLGGLSWRLAPDAPDCPILLRKEQRGLAVQALGPLDVAEDNLIGIVGPVFCRKLYVASSSLATLARTGAYRHVNDKLIALAERVSADGLPRRFYISRRDSARRSMTNELAFEKALGDLGIVSIALSELDLIEKIRLFRNAELVIGAHGAGLSHLMFAKPSLKVVEILPIPAPSYKLLGVQTCFMRLSVVYGHDHTLVLQPMNAGTSEWSPDIAHIERLLAA